MRPRNPPQVQLGATEVPCRLSEEQRDAAREASTNPARATFLRKETLLHLFLVLKNVWTDHSGLSNLTVCITITVLSTEIFSNEMQVIFAKKTHFFREGSLDV